MGNLTEIYNGRVIINGVEIPPAPIKKNGSHSVTNINNKVYINGYEWTGKKWRRTLKALLHYWF